MAGIYIHIPFCRKACHYCNFHFSTSLHKKEELLQPLVGEITDQRFPEGIIPERNISTIYFGGGTPSLLTGRELLNILAAIRTNFEIEADAEITLEANPDDITIEQLETWKQAGINRLSIGVQSFFEADLKWMNRAHNVTQAIDCIRLAKKSGFDNLTIDLIYGTPTLTDEQWKQNVDMALSLGVNHLSCYALTVEEKTPLQYFINKGSIPAIEEEKQTRQFIMLMEWMGKAGFEHYEISNFAKPNHRSRHNSNYWSGAAYYGFGPSAHSFDGRDTRWWNVANNNIYIEKMRVAETYFELEKLTATQHLNERIMTGLRMIEGLTINEEKKEIAGRIVSSFAFENFYRQAKTYEAKKLLQMEESRIALTKEGKLFADGIAAQLFIDE